MEVSMVQAIKQAIVNATGLAKDALHIYVGLAVFLATAAVLRKPFRSRVPWLAVLAVACAGEVVDAIDQIHIEGFWEWPGSVHDIVNTLFWPTVFFLVARYSELLKR
jgi:hypothetical protein